MDVQDTVFTDVVKHDSNALPENLPWPDSQHLYIYLAVTEGSLGSSFTALTTKVRQDEILLLEVQSRSVFEANSRATALLFA